MSDDKTPTLESEGIYLFDTPFTASNCGKAMRYVIETNMLPKDKRPAEIKFIINSPGGDVNACFALIDTIRGSAIPVTTVGLGLIASCGFNLFIAGKKGKRLITPNTSILSHQFSWGSYGKEHELFAQVKEFTLTKKRIVEHYRKCTGLDKKAIRKYLLPAEDVWLSAEEAVELGVADAVVSTY